MLKKACDVGETVDEIRNFRSGKIIACDTQFKFHIGNAFEKRPKSCHVTALKTALETGRETVLNNIR